MARARGTPKAGQDSQEPRAEGPVVIGSRVRELCTAKNWSQQTLAFHANLGVAKVNRVMQGRAGISVPGLMRLAKTLGTSMDYLVGLSDDKRPPK